MAHFCSSKCGVFYPPVGHGGLALWQLTGKNDVLIGMALIAAAVTGWTGHRNTLAEFFFFFP